MPSDQTWQFLPHNLQRALQLQYLTLTEAAGLWDCSLQTLPDEIRPLHPDLWPAARKLYLMQVQPPTPRQH